MEADKTLNRYSKILEPIKIGEVDIKNRVAMAPMGTLGLINSDGSPNDRFSDYYIERARGGVGLIITGIFKVENEIDAMNAGFPLISHAVLSPFAELAESVHALGSRIFVQLTAGLGRVGNPAIYRKQVVSASAVPNYWVPDVTCRALETGEVESIVRSFGIAAKICARAGIDGVEIHALHEGYLLDQFAIGFFNRRTDKYGGDLRRRLKFATQIVQEIKEKAGHEFPVTLRFSVKSYIKDWNQGGLPGEEFIEKGRDIEEGLEAARILEEAGYDAFNADGGSYDAWYWAHPPNYQRHGCYLSLTEKLKKAVKVPVIVAGRMDLPELAETTLEEGRAADMVAIGRGLLADPHWVKKVEEGNPGHIRPCLGCQDGCLGRIFLGRPLSCAVNPSVGRERNYRITPTNKIKKVMIVGGGVSGLEMARVSSIRGHEVTLYEKSDELGGHLIAASVPSFKKDLVRLLKWHKTELETLRVEITTGLEVTQDMIEKEKADVVVIAAGSQPVIPDVPGIENNKVVTAIDILLGKKQIGESIVVVGGGLIGCETALWLADQGKKVSIVEMRDSLMKSPIRVPLANKMMLLDLLEFHSVDSITGHSLYEVTNEGVILIDKGFSKMNIEADTIVLSVGLQSNKELYNSLVGKVPDLYLIGDARDARNIMGSIWDAYEIARAV